MVYVTLLLGAGILYVLSRIIYNLYFHPLARFPGPKITAITKWYEAYYDLIKRPGGQFMFEIDRMHEKYGPIVRINPDELHVKDSSWAGTLYCGPAHGNRDKYAPAAHMTGTPDGIFGTISHEVHRKRRAAVSPFFSKINVTSEEPRIHDSVRMLCDSLEKQITTNGSAEMRQNYLALTTDIVSDHAFGQSLKLLHAEQDAQDWKRTIKAIAILTPLVKQFTWIIPLALRLPLRPLQFVVPDLARIVALRRDMDRQADVAIRSQSKSPIAVSEKSTVARPGINIFNSLLSSKILPNNDKRRNRIAQEAFVVLVAGGETTARILTAVTYHVLANRDTVLPKLKKELEDAIVNPDDRVSVQTLEQLPWLTAVIKESLRITGLVTSRLPLVSPKDPLQYNDWTIPPGTPISMTLRDILHDPEVFADPLEFHPERWFPSNPDYEKVNNGYIPFGRGSRMCVGINLALAEIYLSMAYVFRRFDLELYETTRERDIDHVRDCFIGEVSPSSKGVRVRFTSPKAL